MRQRNVKNCDEILASSDKYLKDITLRALEALENADEIAVIKQLNLMSVKPVIYCANVSEFDLKDGNEYTKRVEEYAKSHGAQTVIICALEKVPVLRSKFVDTKLSTHWEVKPYDIDDVFTVSYPENVEEAVNVTENPVPMLSEDVVLPEDKTEE